MKLKSLEEFSIVGEVRGVGLMSCIECKVHSQNKNSLKIDTKVGERIDKHCQNLGLLLRPIINMCILSPPLIINKTQIDDIFSILYKGIQLTISDLKKEGHISEDLIKDNESDIQKITDDHINELNIMQEEKAKEILEV